MSNNCYRRWFICVVDKKSMFFRGFFRCIARTEREAKIIFKNKIKNLSDKSLRLYKKPVVENSKINNFLKKGVLSVE